jgi:1-phosphofructokinase family hexose kinase
MILTAGLSPAWQHTLEFDRLALGEVNRARAAAWCASGKVVNAARAVHRLAQSAGGQPRGRALTLLGGPTGDRMREALTAEGLDVEALPAAAATRVCTTLLGRADGSVTELVEEASPLSADELQAFRPRFRALAQGAAAVLLTGSLPTGTPPDYYRELLDGVEAPVLLDIRGPELLATLPLGPILVKPNREELARTVGRPLRDDGELRRAMRELAELGARWVLVTQGRDPVWLLGGGEFFRIRPPTVETRNPIGSGDCLAGGMAWAIACGLAPLEAARLGVAAAAANAATLLPGHLDPAVVAHCRAAVQVESA